MRAVRRSLHGCEAAFSPVNAAADSLGHPATSRALKSCCGEAFANQNAGQDTQSNTSAFLGCGQSPGDAGKQHKAEQAPGDSLGPP